MAYYPPPRVQAAPAAVYAAPQPVMAQPTVRSRSDLRAAFSTFLSSPNRVRTTRFAPKLRDLGPSSPRHSADRALNRLPSHPPSSLPYSPQMMQQPVMQQPMVMQAARPAVMSPMIASPAGYYDEQKYCGPISLCIGFFIFPCICCCPVDTRRTWIPNKMTVIC
jgi:hypothetical protein